MCALNTARCHAGSAASMQEERAYDCCKHRQQAAWQGRAGSEPEHEPAAWREKIVQTPPWGGWRATGAPLRSESTRQEGRWSGDGRVKQGGSRRYRGGRAACQRPQQREPGPRGWYGLPTESQGSGQAALPVSGIADIGRATLCDCCEDAATCCSHLVQQGMMMQAAFPCTRLLRTPPKHKPLPCVLYRLTMPLAWGSCCPRSACYAMTEATVIASHVSRCQPINLIVGRELVSSLKATML
jgi:hypothetical protein